MPYVDLPDPLHRHRPWGGNADRSPDVSKAPGASRGFLYVPTRVCAGLRTEERSSGIKKAPPGLLVREGTFFLRSEKHADAGPAHDPVATVGIRDRFHAGIVGHVVAALATRDEWGLGCGVVCVHTPTLVHLPPLVKPFLNFLRTT